MIKEIHFHNFKVLRDTVLPLGPLTVLVGPNGSGKSTVLQGLMELGRRNLQLARTACTAGQVATPQNLIRITVQWAGPHEGVETRNDWYPDQSSGPQFAPSPDGSLRPGRQPNVQDCIKAALARIRVFSLHAPAICAPVQLRPEIEMGPDGSGLAVVLDRLRDDSPERFEQINKELSRCLPEFDAILFETPSPGFRSFALRTRRGQHKISAESLSQGTVLALAILTLAYLPDPPPIVGLEEPDRGLHPRLLRDVQDAMYRLAYPKDHGEDRPPVQVIATTHSPYMLDLFKDHPEEVVIADKTEDNVKFDRLSDRPDIHEILSGSSLGEVWYSGVLGGVPTDR